MSMTLGELGERLAGEVKGDPSVEIHSVMGMDQATPGSITFLNNPKYIPKLQTTRASAVIVSPDFAEAERNLLVVDNPYLAFARATGLLMERKFEPEAGVSDLAFVHPTAELGCDVALYPYAYVNAKAKVGDRVALYPGVYVGEECEVGDDTVIFSNTVLYPRSVVGKRCVLHANVAVGSAGFGYAPDGHKYEKIPQVCRAVIHDDVEIGANSVVNRGATRDTVVGSGTKIDSLVIASHGVQIGEDCLFVSQTGISGTVTIGNHCTFGGQVGIAGHLTIGDNVSVGGKSGVKGDLASGGTYFGKIAMPIEKERRCLMAWPRLPEMRTQLRDLARQVKELKAELAKLQSDEE